MACKVDGQNAGQPDAGSDCGDGCEGVGAHEQLRCEVGKSAMQHRGQQRGVALA